LTVLLNSARVFLVKHVFVLKLHWLRALKDGFLWNLKKLYLDCTILNWEKITMFRVRTRFSSINVVQTHRHTHSAANIVDNFTSCICSSLFPINFSLAFSRVYWRQINQLSDSYILENRDISARPMYCKYYLFIINTTIIIFCIYINTD